MVPTSLRAALGDTDARRYGARRRCPYASARRLPVNTAVTPGRSDGSRDAVGAPRPFLLAQPELLDLAGRSLRKIAEFHCFRALEVGEPLAAEPDQLGL